MTGAQRIESFFLSGPDGRIECLLKHPASAPAEAIPEEMRGVPDG